MITMKVLMTNNSIISLENVRRVDKHISESRHTSYGKPYTVTHYSISIIYYNDGSEHIDCGENAADKTQCETIFQTIYDKISEG